MPPHASESPAKRQSKWSTDEDTLIIDLRASGMKWEDISRRLPGRSAISCRLHYQNYLEKRAEWDEEMKNKLSRLYDRFKEDMWKQVAAEMVLPWRTVEKMHWQLGEIEMARRAGANVFNPNFSTSEEGQRNGSKTSTRHSHSRSQGSSSREGGSGRSYSRGESSSSSRPLASRRESVPPHHLPVYPEHPSEDYGYTHHSMPLAPIQAQSQPLRLGMLPGVNELTTGISPYSTPAYSLPVPGVSPVTSSTSSPGSYMMPMGYPPLEPAGSKRRRSPENHMSPEMSRRRHLDPRT